MSLLCQCLRMGRVPTARPAPRLRRWPSLCTVLGLLLVLTVAPAVAATYWVSTTGNDGNSCSAAQNNTSARRTINSGIACLNGGDTLIVRNGTYTGAVNSGNIPNGPSNSVRTIVRAENTRQALISVNQQGTAAFSFHSGKQNITIQGFVQDGNGAWASGGLDFNAEGGGLANITVQDGEIRNMDADDQYQGSGSDYQTTAAIGASWPATNIVMRNLYVHDIGMNCAGGGCCNECYGYGIYLSGTGYTLEQSEFANTSGWTVHGYPNANDPGFNIIRNNYLHDSGAPLLMCRPDSQIYNNILVNLGHMGIGVPAGIQIAGSCGGGTIDNFLIYNNTIVGCNGDCINLGYGENGQIRNNICYQNGDDTVADGGGGNQQSNNLFGTNPQFNGTGGGIQTYRLTSGSPAVNAGTNTGSIASLVTTDIGGATRPVGGAWDIGAWEFGGAVGPPTCPDCASCNASCTCPAACTPEVAAWWKFDEGAGTIANDSTATGTGDGTRDMTVTNSWGAGKVGPSAYVCGSGTATVFTSTTYSWIGWLQGTTAPGVSGGNSQEVLHNGTLEPAWGFNWNHPALEAVQAAWHRDGGGNYVNAKLTTALQAGVWYHVAAIYNGTTLRAFLNGALHATTTITSVFPATGSFSICTAPNSEAFAGRIDNLKVYPNVLTPADILADYTATQGSVATRARPRVVRTE